MTNFILVSPWSPKLTQVILYLKAGIASGTIDAPPLDVIAQQNGNTVFCVGFDADLDILALTLADFAGVTFPLAATIRIAKNGAHVPMQIT